MKEKPILFSGPMVRAILAGTKTQTRRVVKRLPWYDPASNRWIVRGKGRIALQFNTEREAFAALPLVSPYGNPGHRLWVREAWRPNWTVEHGHLVEFAADNAIRCFNGCCNGLKVVEPGYDWLTSHYDCYKKPWHPSIHMPRWASRILLEVTAVRVERLNDISEADAMAEGVEVDECGHAMRENDVAWGGARTAYADLWEQINGPGSWAADPWVWVIEFKRV